MTHTSDTDPLAFVRAAVAELIGFGTDRGRQVAPAAHLSRLGMIPPDYDRLAERIAEQFGVDLVIGTADRVQAVADAIDVALGRRAAADAPTRDPLGLAMEGLMP